MINIKKLSYKIREVCRSVRRGRRRPSDDFDWEIYNTHYRGELEEVTRIYAQILEDGDYLFQNGHLIKNNEKILSLHPNYKLLYETILQLAPESAVEIGCGGCDHLHNLSMLCPDIKLFGTDISSKQLHFSKERHPDLKAEIKQFDSTLPLPCNAPNIEMAYTQAVIMHIQTGNGHLVALSNLFRLASKQVILMENWKKHNFLDDINKLFNLGIIPWPQLFFYYRICDESQETRLMIISSNPLEQYDTLAEYKMLFATE